jgi:hypothetical protein
MLEEIVRNHLKHQHEQLLEKGQLPSPLRSRPLSSLITASGHARRAFAAHDKTNNAGHPAGGMPSRNDANKNIARKQQRLHRDLASVRDTTLENSAVPEQR